MSEIKTVGSKLEVARGLALRTSGGLTEKNIFYDEKDGRYKSKAQSEAAKKNPALKAWRAAVKKTTKKIFKGEKFVPITGKIAEKARKEFEKKYKK